LRKSILSLAIILAVALAASARQPQGAMKGYELYSWKADGKWHYSLVVGTNRVKSYEEITSNKNVQVGDAAIRDELKKLTRGEQVFWMSDGPPGARKAAEWSSIKLPSRSRIKSLMAYCDKLGIKLQLH
jgi:lysophospholipid acyltransferase (LPLAT)-like uncharacterized protein